MQALKLLAFHVNLLSMSKQRREAFVAERVGVSQLKLVGQRVLCKKDPQIAWLVPVELY